MGASRVSGVRGGGGCNAPGPCFRARPHALGLLASPYLNHFLLRDERLLVSRHRRGCAGRGREGGKERLVCGGKKWCARMVGSVVARLGGGPGGGARRPFSGVPAARALSGGVASDHLADRGTPHATGGVEHELPRKAQGAAHILAAGSVSAAASAPPLARERRCMQLPPSRIWRSGHRRQLLEGGSPSAAGSTAAHRVRKERPPLRYSPPPALDPFPPILVRETLLRQHPRGVGGGGAPQSVGAQDK